MYINIVKININKIRSFNSYENILDSRICMILASYYYNIIENYNLLERNTLFWKK